MTQPYNKLNVLVSSTLFLLASFYVPSTTLQTNQFQTLQCNESRKNNLNLTDKIYCFNNTTTNLIEFVNDNQVSPLLHVKFNCYNGNLLKNKLPLDERVQKNVTLVEFNSCRFSENDDIFQILNSSIQLTKLESIRFENNFVESFISRRNIKGLDESKIHLTFSIRNISTLPMDLFADLKNLAVIDITSSNASNSLHLSDLLAPLKNLIRLTLSVTASDIILFPPGFFSNHKNLQYLCLIGNNSLSDNPKNIFLRTQKTENFPVYQNGFMLQKQLFWDLTSLKDVEIISCQLGSIYFDTFAGLKNISRIMLHDNNLQELPLGLFAEQKNLIWLDLSENKITNLVADLFKYNTRLYSLNLSDNQLKSLSVDIFKPLSNLTNLALENNKLLTISADNNRPQLGSIFDDLKQLNNLILKENSIKKIPYNIIKVLKLTSLDLSYNKINSIDCDFVTNLNKSTININITGNPIICDCNNLCLHQYVIQHSMSKNIGLREIQCQNPSSLKGKLLYELNPGDLLCFPDNLPSKPSNSCTYDIRTADLVLVMNCSGGNFNDIPTHPVFHQLFSNGIELFMNSFTNLSSTTIIEKENITLISIKDCKINKLPKRFLSGLPRLRNVSIVLPLTELADDVFQEPNEIVNLKISGTDMNEFSQNFFQSKMKLISLDLSRNRIEQIKEHSFANNTILEELRLSYNLLETLSANTFKGLCKLKTLYLDNNRIHDLGTYTFYSTPIIEFINMENNRMKTVLSFLPSYATIQTVIISNNSLLIENDYLILFQRLSSASVENLRLYNFSTIQVTSFSAFLEGVNAKFLNFNNSLMRTVEVKNGKSFDCLCDIVSVEQNNRMYEILKCPPSTNYRNHQFSNLSADELSFPIKESCPNRCNCWIRLIKSILIVNCANRSLTEVPTLPESEQQFQNGIELLIEHNQLTSLNPRSQSGYKNVIKIDASHNHITNIYSEDIPPNISQLNVSYNKIERLDDKVIMSINATRTLKSIYLYANPIICDCSSENLTKFIRGKKELFPDIDQCKDGQKFDTLLYADCAIESSSSKSIIVIVICIAIIVVLAVLFVLSTLYFTNKEHVMVWMYAHNICLGWITEEELDKDKKYDAFISYSSLDEEFVANELVSKLESGPKPYKLCLHDRDWLGGVFIPDQIEQSVESSKRTIIVMTENYVKSRWTRLEFRIAHIASMNEKRARVIVIILGDVNTDNLDSDLQKYIKMYTYIKWGDTWFWEKLGYELPHLSQKNQPTEQYEMKMIQNGEGVIDDRETNEQT